MNAAIQACIFDLDGLMVNSEELSLVAWRRVLAPFGKSLNEQEYFALIGQDSQASTEQVIRALGIPLSWEQLARAHWQELIAIIQRDLEPRPGLIELVSVLSQAGFPLAIASNSPSDYVEQAVQAIGLRAAFRCVIGRDQVARGKPAPDVYLAAAAGLGAEPARCLAFEDSPTGLQAALAAGMRCIVVPNERLPRADFTGAYRRCASLTAVPEALGDLLKPPA
jgi:HAD superfamily hydrolase (TIGR01509 family)